MKTQVSLWVLMSLVVSLVEPAFGMEGLGDKDFAILKTKQPSKREKEPVEREKKRKVANSSPSQSESVECELTGKTPKQSEPILAEHIKEAQDIEKATLTLQGFAPELQQGIYYYALREEGQVGLSTYMALQFTTREIRQQASNPSLLKRALEWTEPNCSIEDWGDLETKESANRVRSIFITLNKAKIMGDFPVLNYIKAARFIRKAFEDSAPIKSSRILNCHLGEIFYLYFLNKFCGGFNADDMSFIREKIKKTFYLLLHDAEERAEKDLPVNPRLEAAYLKFVPIIGGMKELEFNVYSVYSEICKLMNLSIEELRTVPLFKLEVLGWRFGDLPYNQREKLLIAHATYGSVNDKLYLASNYPREDGSKFPDGNKGSQWLDKARENLKEKAKAGDLNAIIRISQDMTEETAPYLEKAARLGDRESQCLFAKGYAKKGDFEKAAYWYQQSVDQADAKARYNLSKLYLKGVGVQKDEKMSKDLLKKAARQGLDKAQYDLGILYLKKYKDNPKKGMEWIAKAAETTRFTKMQFKFDAQYRLGVAYAKGEGVDKNPEKAEKLLVEAGIEWGYFPALLKLGKWYKKGKYPDPKNDARLCLSEAAYTGDPAALFHYGSFLTRNPKNPSDWVEGLEMYKKAAAKGHQKAALHLQGLRENWNDN